MGLFSKDIKTLDDLFVHTLQDIYYAEQQITKALPEMISKATDPQLKQAFQTHLGETEQHVKMVEQVFRMHGHDPQGVTCPAIDGIIDEAQDIAGDVEDPEVLDAAFSRPLRPSNTMRLRAMAPGGFGQATRPRQIAREFCIKSWTRRNPRTRSSRASPRAKSTPRPHSR